jgi:hypothetical protein
MNDPNDIRHDLGPDMPDDLVRLAEHLRDVRPLPSPAFRGRLGRSLENRSRRVHSPARIRILITRYATAGTMLLLVGTLGAAGAGPFGS